MLLLVPLEVGGQDEVHAQQSSCERLDAGLQLQAWYLVDHLLHDLAQAGCIDELSQLSWSHVKVSARAVSGFGNKPSSTYCELCAIVLAKI